MTNLSIQWKGLPASALTQDDKLLQDWDRLNAAHGGLPFLAADAIVSAPKILGDGSERLLVGHQDTTLLAMFLLSPGVSITQVDPRIAPRAEDTPDSQHTDYIDTGWIDIEGSFDDYWSGRGKNLRQNHLALYRWPFLKNWQQPGVARPVPMPMSMRPHCLTTRLRRLT